MKARISLAAVALACGVVLAVAAEKGKKAADPCAETYDKCTQVCSNEQMNCKSRGTDPAECERRYKKCSNDCDKAKADCAKGKKT